MKSSGPRVLQVSAEIFPLLKTGGLADVTGALPAALARQGCEVRALLPGFPALREGLRDAVAVGRVVLPWGGEPAKVLRGTLAPLGITAYLVEHAGLYQRPGNPYQDEQQRAYPDNHHRFALLGLAAAQLAEGLDASWRPELVHGHDWHAGLASAYLHFSRAAGLSRAASVFTVHNLAYQGIFAPEVFAGLGLPESAFAMQGLEFHGQVSFMKAGLHYADRITTVSPSYAREILAPEQGCGLDGVLRERAAREQGSVSGILNGVDDTVWNPASDALIAQRYSAARLSAKTANKVALQREFKLDVRADAPLFVVVSRLTEQKGLHLVAALVPRIVAAGGQLALLGSGDAALQQAFEQRARAQPRSVALRVGYDEALAHRLIAGGDVILVPSRFEPCGLTQLYGLKYGTLPLVHRVGGLADTVVDCTLEDLADDRATGFVFERFSAEECERALRRALTLYRRPDAWQQVQRRAMAQDFGWDAAAARMLKVYRAAVPPSSTAAKA